jgi:hypothetical protein
MLQFDFKSKVESGYEHAELSRLTVINDLFLLASMKEGYPF